jgi:co-chaperonin GroES (HSP10)
MAATSVVAVLLFTIVPVCADAASIAQGYNTTDSDLITGMAAALSPDASSNAQSVVRAATSNKQKFVGIVTTKNANLMTLTNNVATVVVTTSGEANALLTDANGVVKKGDNLTVSPIKGILMKADGAESSIIGSALEGFASNRASKQTFSTNDGKSREVSIAAVQIEIHPNNVSTGVSADSSFLRILGQNIAGKTVSDWQAVIALVIFLLLLVVEGSLIYGSIHSTITALGRNPMAHDAVYKQLFQVILAVLAILAFGIATIYAVLQI